MKQQASQNYYRYSIQKITAKNIPVFWRKIKEPKAQEKMSKRPHADTASQHKKIKMAPSSPTDPKSIPHEQQVFLPSTETEMEIRHEESTIDTNHPISLQTPVVLLCDDVVMHIFQFLDFKTCLSMQLVSTLWSDLSKKILQHVQVGKCLVRPISFRNLPNLTRLTVHNQYQDNEFCYRKAKCIFTAFKRLPREPLVKVTSFTLNNSALPTNAEIVRKFPSLTSLDLGRNAITTLEHVVNLSNLTCLNLADNAIGKKAIACIVSHPNMKSLTVLNVGRNNLQPQCIDSIIDSPNMQNLTWLNVMHCWPVGHTQTFEQVKSSPFMKNLNSFANDTTLFKNCSVDAIRTFLAQDGTAFRHAPESMRDDESVVMSILKQRGNSTFGYVSPRLRKDKAIVDLALQQDKYAIKFVAPELFTDREFILQIVKQYDGQFLKYGPEELQHDREVVLCAVRQYGQALEFTSMELRNDKEVVLCAVGQDGVALRFASRELQNDREVVLCAMKQCGLAFTFASEELKQDREMRKVYGCFEM